MSSLIITIHVHDILKLQQKYKLKVMVTLPYFYNYLTLLFVIHNR